VKIKNRKTEKRITEQMKTDGLKKKEKKIIELGFLQKDQ